MSQSLVLPLVLRAAEEGAHSGPNHWLIGGIVLLIFLGMLIGLVSFGGGREHS
jgi:hypothetical protein